MAVEQMSDADDKTPICFPRLTSVVLPAAKPVQEGSVNSAR
jgi:hypothetical protein